MSYRIDQQHTRIHNEIKELEKYGTLKLEVADILLRILQLMQDIHHDAQDHYYYGSGI